MTKKILFVDCDGTIRQPKSGAKFINNPRDQEAIAGMPEALREFKQKGYLIIIGITNQAGVAAGHKSLEDAILEQQITLDLFPEISSILFCPDFEGNKCFEVWRNTFEEKLTRPKLKGRYRKPSPGMLLEVLESEKVDPSNCVMIGDRQEDEDAAIAAGVAFTWV